MDNMKHSEENITTEGGAKSTDDRVLETNQEHKERLNSLRVIYFTMFLMALGFSVVLTGVWPYLNELDPAADKEFMGYVIAANPLAQMLFSPLMGWWGNRRGSVRLPLIASLLLFTGASAIYSMLHVFPPTTVKYWMFISRFLVGISSANIAICRSYLSAATKLSERTNAVSMISLAQVLGFIVGPALQAAVTPLGKQGEVLLDGWLTLNMYTAAGWINVLLGLVNALLFTPIFFTEKLIAAKEAMILTGAESERAAWKIRTPDILCTWTMMVSFFTLVFNFVLLETLGTSLTMEQFAWTKKEALSNMGLLLSAGGIIACVSFLLIGTLAKRFNEIRVLIWGGFFLMVLGRAVFIPWGEPPPVIAYQQNSSLTNGSEVVGCPEEQKWCMFTPAMTLRQFLLGFILTTIGYPIGVTLIQTIFSKLLGSRPQGVWMGLMTGAGCLSRVLGPVFVSHVYTRLGTVWTFGITTVMMSAAMIWLQFVFRRINGAVVTMSSGTKHEIENSRLQDDNNVELDLIHR